LLIVEHSASSFFTEDVLLMDVSHLFAGLSLRSSRTARGLQLNLHMDENFDEEEAMIRELNTVEKERADSIPNNFEARSQEEFLPDSRAELRPSEIVQTKLLSLLSDAPVPVSCLHTHRETRRWNARSSL
jgi:hypothetical protein